MPGLHSFDLKSNNSEFCTLLWRGWVVVPVCPVVPHMLFDLVGQLLAKLVLCGPHNLILCRDLR